MIGFVEGALIAVEDRAVILKAGGVGYRVFVTPAERDELAGRMGDTISLWTHTVAREDALDLYGFRSREEHTFFSLLITVPGIGPKSALTVIAVSSLPKLITAIGSGDLAYLTKIGGIGRKTAEKIILELREKVGTGGEAITQDEGDVLEALKALGYTERDARDVLKKIPNELSGTNARLKEALRLIGK